MQTNPDTAARKRKRNTIIAIVIGILLLLLFLRLSCRPEAEALPEPKPEPEPQAMALLVPDQVPERFDVAKPEEIVDFCRSQIASANYAGVARGAYGTLWAGSGNAIDRLLLMGAVLDSRGHDVRVLPGDEPQLWYEDEGWKAVDLDGETPITAADKPAEEAVELAEVINRVGDQVHRIGFAFEIEDDNYRGRDRPPPLVKLMEDPLPLAECTYMPIVVRVTGEIPTPEEGEWPSLDSAKYEIRVGDAVLLDSGSLSGVDRVVLRIDWHHGDQTVSYRRELFHTTNAKPMIPGHPFPVEGDRYVVAIGSGPVLPDVLKTREQMFELDRYTPLKDESERSLLLLATRYMQEVDKVTGDLTKAFAIDLVGVEPRIVITAVEMAPADIQAASSETLPPAMSIDVINDQVNAVGTQSRYFQSSRSLALDEIETRVLFDAIKMPVVSASTVLSHFKSGESDTIQRRIDYIQQEAERILQEETFGTRVVFEAHALSDETGETGPSLVLERAKDSFLIHGLELKDDEEIRVSVWKPGETLVLGPRARDVAQIIEAHLRLQVGTSWFRIDGQLKSAWKPKGLAVVDGSILTYEIQGPDGKGHQVVFVSMQDGTLGGTCVDLESDQTSTRPLTGAWPKAFRTPGEGVGEILLPQLLAIMAPSDIASTGKPESFQLKVADETLSVDAVRVSLGKESQLKYVPVEVVLLPAGKTSLILAMHDGENSITLKSATPVMQGRVIDAQTDRPIAMALVTDRGGVAATRTSVDGFFRLPLSEPLKDRLILVIDLSGSMEFGLDPSSEEAVPPAEQRIAAVRLAAANLLAGLPANVEVALWTFNQPHKRYYGNYSESNLVTIQQDFTTDRELIRTTLAAVEPLGGTPLTSVLNRLNQALIKDPLSRGATVIVLADGDNSCTSMTASEAHEKMRHRLPVHTIGFAIDPEGKAGNQLEELARASGGSHQVAGSQQELVIAFERFQRDLDDVGISVVSRNHIPVEKEVSLAVSNPVPIEVRLEPGGYAGALMFIGKDNSKDLDLCEELSPKAKKMIEERIESGKWVVLIPNRRTNIAEITAYGWMEIEHETGRCIGRTEDGLHGSWAGGFSGGMFGGRGLEGGLNWPLMKSDRIPPLHPMAAFVRGVSTYSAGSVVAALQWYKQPGFLTASSFDFMNYVMVNALQNVFAWHKGIGRYLSLPIGDVKLQTDAISRSSMRPNFKMFPITGNLLSSLSEEEAFWAGVGLSMELQLMVARRFKKSENP
jgi:hypothetical protein